MTSEPRNKLFTFKNALNVIYIGVVFLLLFNPAAKALLIRALMSVGFFQPDIVTVKKPRVRENLPAVSFTDNKGNKLQLSNLQGKVVFINFWATWCPPCLAEMPGINQLYNRFKNNPNVAFITVDVDQELSKSEAFFNKHNWNLPLYQVNSNLPSSLSGESIPLTVILDREGKIVYQHEGTANYGSDKMVEFIQTLSL